jgi:hypothetical protein
MPTMGGMDMGQAINILNVNKFKRQREHMQRYIKLIIKFLAITCIFSFHTANASKWVGCHGCIDFIKEKKARGFSQENSVVRVNVLDVESETLTTYRVTNLTEYEPGNEFSHTLVTPVSSTNEELEAKDFAISVYHEIQNQGTTISAGDLGNVGSTYGNSGFLVNSNNAANVSAALNSWYSSFINSWNVNLTQNTVGSLASAAQGLVVTVVFMDGSSAIFTLDKILTNLSSDGCCAIGFYFDFNLKQIRDKDGNVIPMTPTAANGSTTSVSGGAMEAWSTAFSTMGLSFLGGGNTGSYTVTCTVSGDRVVCTAKRKDK